MAASAEHQGVCKLIQMLITKSEGKLFRLQSATYKEIKLISYNAVHPIGFRSGLCRPVQFFHTKLEKNILL